MSDARPGPFLVLTGPTAVGKTEISFRIAERLDAEIISLDSRQIYRGLDAGTAKPSQRERARVPHHFVDELPLGAAWSAGRFAEAANERIGSLLARGRMPLVVGGSTLYLEALAHGLAEVPAAEPAVRAALMERVEGDGGAATLYEDLLRIDPATAGTLDATKTQRLVRALEVYYTTGRPLSSYFADVNPPPYRYRIVVLYREREALYRRIEARVAQMLEAGLLEENRGLLEAGFRLDTNPLRTIGYQEPFAYLRGKVDYDEMVRRLTRNTRRYAKRQLTWFRRRTEYAWLCVEDEDWEVLLQ